MGTRIGKIAAERIRGDLELNGLAVTNIVATVDFEREFDLGELAQTLPGSDYEPEISPFLLFKPESATVMIPRTGKVSIVGANKVEDVNAALESLLDEFDGLGLSVEGAEPIVENIVVNGSIGGEIELAEVAVGLGLENTEYEPEQFPGLIYRPVNNATVLLFRTGTFVITGTTNYGDVWEVAQHFTESLNEMGVSNVDLIGE